MEKNKENYIDYAANLKKWTLSQRQICDIELILNGAFNPLKGFTTKSDYNTILENMRLKDGTVWPIPITLDISKEFAENITENEDIALLDQETNPIAILTISDIWKPNKKYEAHALFNTNDPSHPGVDYLNNATQEIYIGGNITQINPPKHYDFTQYRHTPEQLKDIFKKNKWKKIIAFQTRNPIHKAHFTLTQNAAKKHNAALLIHPVTGMTKPGDIDHYTRVRCYKAVLKHYQTKHIALSLLQLAMRMAGPKEALWHAIIRKNYGCTHFIVGRHHASPGKDAKGNEFYTPYEAQELTQKYQDEIGIKIIPVSEVAYDPDKKIYVTNTKNKKTISISGTELRQKLEQNNRIPSWFSFPNVIAELRKSRKNIKKQGFCVFFTGLSGAGKSTVANVLTVKLMEIGTRPVSLLDGDVVRKHLSSELGFSKEHRDINISRIGYVASEIVKNAGIAICAPIAPYEYMRKNVRQLNNQYGTFIEIYVETPIEICEKRDTKGLYKLARQGKIKNFTGINDPYEIPQKPEITINTINETPEQNTRKIIRYIKQIGLM